jgi:hypothetical protein
MAINAADELTKSRTAAAQGDVAQALFHIGRALTADPMRPELMPT